MYRYRAIFFTIVVICAALTAEAQYGSFGLTDARQLALGNTYASNSRELYAAGKNPSLLAWPYSEKKVSILFPNLSARAYNVQKVTDFFNQYFSQKPIDIITGINGALIQRALQHQGKLYLGLQIGYFSAGFYPDKKIGAFSIAWKDYLTGYIQLPYSITEYHTGNETIKGFYFNDFKFQSSWLRAYELSWGKEFKVNPSSGISAIYTGAAVKYYSGFLYNNINISGGAGYIDENNLLVGSYHANNLSAYSDDINLKNSFNGKDVITNVPFMDPVGNGVGFDFGLAMVLVPGIKLGASITDAGLINWRGKTRQTLIAGVIKIDSSLNLETLDSLSQTITIEKETANNFRTNPPTALHLGIDLMINKFIKKLPGEMNLALELHQGVSNEMVDNPEQVRLAAGLLYKPGKWWPIALTGITNGPDGSLAWSIGIGYELPFVEFYLSSPNILPKFQNSDLQTLSISLCWHFVKMEKQKKQD